MIFYQIGAVAEQRPSRNLTHAIEGRRKWMMKQLVSAPEYERQLGINGTTMCVTIL